MAAVRKENEAPIHSDKRLVVEGKAHSTIQGHRANLTLLRKQPPTMKGDGSELASLWSGRLSQNYIVLFVVNRP
jgi:hypothetical protein